MKTLVLVHRLLHILILSSILYCFASLLPLKKKKRMNDRKRNISLTDCNYKE